MYTQYYMRWTSVVSASLLTLGALASVFVMPHLGSGHDSVLCDTNANANTNANYDMNTNTKYSYYSLLMLILHFTILYFTIPYCTILCSAILYYTIPYYQAMMRAACPGSSASAASRCFWAPYIGPYIIHIYIYIYTYTYYVCTL